MIPGQITYSSLKSYLGTVKGNEARLEKVQSIIDSLYDLKISRIAEGFVEEYELDDGQVKIKTKYTTEEEITRDINRLRKIKFELISDLTGRVTRNRNYKNFPNGLWR
jgi:hypothetical protein